MTQGKAKGSDWCLQDLSLKLWVYSRGVGLKYVKFDLPCAQINRVDSYCFLILEPRMFLVVFITVGYINVFVQNLGWTWMPWRFTSSKNYFSRRTTITWIFIWIAKPLGENIYYVPLFWSLFINSKLLLMKFKII